MNKLKSHRESHSSGSPVGSGDYYGTGIRQPIGMVRRDYMNSQKFTSKSLGKPPKSLA